MRVIGITGYKKSGKTTLTLKLSDELTKKGSKEAETERAIIIKILIAAA